jgi:O-Antigen ligase
MTEKSRGIAIPATLAIGVVAGIAVGIMGVKFSGPIALAAALGALVGLVLLRFPNYALYLTVALIPIERFGRFTDDNTQFTISLMRIMGMVALAVLLIHRFVRKKPITFGPAFFMYAGYVAMGMLSILYTTDTLGTVRGASSIFGNLLFFFVVVNMATSRRLIIASIIIWLMVSAGITVYSTYDWHFGSGQSDLTVMSGDDDPGKGVQTQENRWATVWQDHAELESLGSSLRRSMGPTSHAAVYAINCILTIPFFLYILRLPVARIWKVAALVALALAGYNILLTNTRAAILVAGLIGLICLARGLVRLRPGQYIALLIVLISSIGFIPSDVFTRILDLSNYSLENSASLRIRIEYAKAGLEAISEHWLYGSGLANENIVPSHLNSWSTAPERTTVHNEYLQTLMEVGFIGGFFLYGFVGLLFYYAVRAARNFARNSDTEQEYWLMVAIQIAMLSVVIYGAQVDVFHFPLKGWWLLAGITVSMFTLSNRMTADRPTPDSESTESETPAHA